MTATIGPRYNTDACVLDEARRIFGLDMPDNEVRLWLCCHLAEAKRMRDALDQDATARGMSTGASPFDHLQTVRDEQERERADFRTTVRVLAGELSR